MSEYYPKSDIQKELKEVQKENKDDETALNYCKCKLIIEQTIKDAIQMKTTMKLNSSTIQICLKMNEIT